MTEKLQQLLTDMRCEVSYEYAHAEMPIPLYERMKAQLENQLRRSDMENQKGLERALLVLQKQKNPPVTEFFGLAGFYGCNVVELASEYYRQAMEEVDNA